MSDNLSTTLFESHKPHYKLHVYIDSEDDVLINSYLTNFSKNLRNMNSYNDGCNICIDAGIDIFTPISLEVNAFDTIKVNTNVKCAMYFYDGDANSNYVPCGFYMYPRSSTGSNTPLRLANSVGIIDSGYRGHLIGVFDNIKQHTYNITQYQRLLQICAPNITYPIYPILVFNINMLECYIDSNARGDGGFGSTGV